MRPSRDISRLIEIMAALRAPETGCPWDIEQNFKTIAPYTIEEAYEVADAIARDDPDDLRQELGDLLLQVVYHARMAEEAIKAEEKTEKRNARLARGLTAEDHGSGFLDGVPVAFPALTRALKLQEKAARVGFDWGEAAPILDKIEEEIAELREAMARSDKVSIKDEFGDVLFALVNFGRHLKIDAEAALSGTNEKFRARFHHVESALTASGRSLDEASLEEMEKLWQQAKRAK